MFFFSEPFSSLTSLSSRFTLRTYVRSLVLHSCLLAQVLHWVFLRTARPWKTCEVLLQKEEARHRDEMRGAGQTMRPRGKHEKKVGFHHLLQSQVKHRALTSSHRFRF